MNLFQKAKAAIMHFMKNRHGCKLEMYDESVVEEQPLSTENITFSFCNINYLQDEAFISLVSDELKVPDDKVDIGIRRMIKDMRQDIICCIEYPYIDVYYRDTYYSFYSKKHCAYSRYCFRISFFSGDVNGNVLLVENFDVELTDEPVKVYNFEVEDFHTYHVCTLGVLVHNAGKNYASLEPDKYTELTQSEVKDILKERGLDEQAAQNLIDSFDGPIYKREGFEGEAFTITESNAGEASGVFVTRESAGITHTERINNLALPPNNTAMAESTVQLTRSQILLEGKVAAQPDWAVIADDGIPRSGGGWQVVTDGGKYNDAIER